MRSPRLTFDFSSTLRRAPNGSLKLCRSLPSSSTTTTCMLRLMTMSSPWAFFTVLRLIEADRAVMRRFHHRLLGHLRRAADVERAHGELRARLADGLRRDDADRFADIHLRAAREVAAVAGAANAGAGFARQHRAHLHRLHARLLDRDDDVLVEEGAARRRRPCRCSDRRCPPPRCGRGCACRARRRCRRRR